MSYKYEIEYIRVDVDCMGNQYSGVATCRYNDKKELIELLTRILDDDRVIDIKIHNEREV